MKKVLCSLSLLTATGLCLAGGLTNKQTLSLKAEPVLLNFSIDVTKLRSGINELYTTNGNLIEIVYANAGGSTNRKTVYTSFPFQCLKTISFTGKSANSSGNINIRISIGRGD